MYNHQSFDPMSGVLFNGLHSYRDYGLFLMEPPDYGNPEPKLYGIDIPGADGTLDTTEATTGNVTYANRQQTYHFKVQVEPWTKKAVQDRIRNALHGRTVQIIPDEDPEWFYTGRASVSFPETHTFDMQVVVSVSAYPYKLALAETDLLINPDDMEISENVNLGRGTEAQGSNSIFYFGNENQNNLDFSTFSRLIISWDGESPRRSSAVVQFNDTEGNVFNNTIPSPPKIGTARYVMTNIGNVVASKIWRVLVSGIGRATLTGEPNVTTYTGTIYNSRMPVVPVIISDFQSNVDVFINGAAATIKPGENENPALQLKDGENEIFVSASGYGRLQIRYREGAL